MNLTAGKNFAITKTDSGLIIGKILRPEPIERQDAAPSPEPFDLSSMHYYTSVTGDDQVTVANMRVYYPLPAAATLNFYDDEDENITGFDADVTYYLYVEATNFDNAGSQNVVTGDTSDAVPIPDSEPPSYYFSSTTAIRRAWQLTYRDMGDDITDEIHVVKYDEVPEDSAAVTRWLIATVRRNGEEGPLEVRQKHLGALFLPGDTLLLNPTLNFAVGED